jgi:hypothetical protein
VKPDQRMMEPDQRRGELDWQQETAAGFGLVLFIN